MKKDIEDLTIKELENICKEFIDSVDLDSDCDGCNGCPLITGYFCPIPVLILVKDELKESS